MSDTSSQWQKVPLKRCFRKLVNGGTPSTTIPSYWGGSIPWVTGADFTDRGIGEIRRYVSELGIRSSSTSVVDKGNLLLVTRTGVGKLAIAKQQIAISQDITGVYPDSEVISVDFLYYLFRKELTELKKLNQGTSINGIIRSDLERHEVTIPIKIAYQEKIASVLQTLDKTIEKTEALIKKYQQIKTGLMHDLFTRGIGADGKLRPPREQAPELYQKTPIGWIPKEWAMSRIENCGSVKLGRQRSPDQHSGKWTMPYLRVANVFDGFFRLEDVLEMDFTPNERNVFSLKAGDILLNEGQSLELVGRSALYLGEENRYCFQNTLVRFRCFEKNSPLFYSLLFKYFLDTGVFMAIASQTTSVAHLGADRFARLKCSVPPFPEQEVIAQKLGLINEKIAKENNILRKYVNQKSGLMHDLLTGKVEVLTKLAER